MSPAGRILACAIAYGVLVTVAVVALSLTPNGVYAYGLAMGAALLVTMFAALGDVRLAPRLALTGALGGFAVGLPLIPICTTDTSFFDADVGQFLLFWFAVFSVVIGLLLPIRVYQGTLGRATLRESARRPSLGGLFAIIGYFALVALPLSAALEGNGGVGAMFMALILWGACAAPVLALLSESLRWRILGATLSLGVVALGVGWIAATSDTEWSFAIASLGTLLTPLAGVVVLWLNGYRLRR